ncbi:hypothetical protein ACIOHS_12480 [Streptomyces sp. NPDC088253]|uniref:hypothetical protein n=1 Tax=Streptomyces sp. NPDC088253 TaxID=3365846 RepID=UPI003810826B
MTAPTQQPTPEAQLDPGYAAFARTVLRVYGIHAGTAPHPMDIEGAQTDLSAEFAREVAEQAVIEADWLIWWLGRASRASKPLLLWQAFTSGKLSTDTLTAVLTATWCVSDTLQLPFEQWRAMFHTTGYTDDGHPWFRPRQPVELWRGATDEDRAGPYWTPNQVYAERIMRNRPGTPRLWYTLAPPHALLAHFNASTGDEYVVDPRGLTITPAP